MYISLHVEDRGLGTPAGKLRLPLTVMEELVAMTTSGDDTSEGAKGEEGEVHMYMYIEMRYMLEKEEIGERGQRRK